MPDSFDANGLQVKTLAEIRAEHVANFKAIYGNDINVDQNSPDGQALTILAQVGVDVREQLVKINAGFDPDQSEGIVLDQRLGLNGIKRNGGTYTIQPVSITTDKALNLVGLDGAATELEPDIANLYTVKDDAGTEFYLLTSQSIVGAGTASYDFRAAEIGQIEVLPNTITTAVTIISGVTVINNPASPSTVGVDQEDDADAKIRRKSSVSIPAIGYLDAIEAALQDLDNVVTADVYENDTKFYDISTTIDANTIWCIVEGGTDATIAAVIYAKKSSGSGMKGDELVNVIRSDGVKTIPIRFDRPDDQNLHIRFKLTGDTYDSAQIKSGIVANIFWSTGRGAAGSIVTAYVQGLNSEFKIEDMEISENGSSWYEVLDSPTLKDKFINDTTRITITS